MGKAEGGPGLDSSHRTSAVSVHLHWTSNSPSHLALHVRSQTQAEAYPPPSLPSRYHCREETHVKAKKRVVAPTKKMAAAETGTYLLGLNLFADSAGMLELCWEICPAA